jgi:hypothetical protein
MKSFALKAVSFTPGFSPVEGRSYLSRTVLTVSALASCLSTGLKPGVNKMIFETRLR